MRAFEDKIYLGLKTATQGLVDAFGVLKQAEAASRVSLQMLATYYNRGQAHLHTYMPVDVMIDLMKKSGDLGLLEYIASIFGKKLVDECAGTAGDEPICASMNAIKGMGLASASLAEAAGDNTITIEEAKKCLQELNEAEQQIADCRETLTAIITR